MVPKRMLIKCPASGTHKVLPPLHWSCEEVQVRPLEGEGQQRGTGDRAERLPLPRDPWSLWAPVLEPVHGSLVPVDSGIILQGHSSGVWEAIGAQLSPRPVLPETNLRVNGIPFSKRVEGPSLLLLHPPRKAIHFSSWARKGPATSASFPLLFPSPSPSGILQCLLHPFSPPPLPVFCSACSSSLYGCVFVSTLSCLALRSCLFFFSLPWYQRFPDFAVSPGGSRLALHRLWNRSFALLPLGSRTGFLVRLA